MSDQQSSQPPASGTQVTTMSTGTSTVQTVAVGSGTPTQTVSTGSSAASNNSSQASTPEGPRAASRGTPQQHLQQLQQQPQQVTMVTSMPVHIANQGNTQHQMSVTPTLTHIVASSPQGTPIPTQQAATAGAVIRSSQPGAVQIIQGHPFVQQHQYMQQQYYIQSVQGMHGQPIAQQVNLTPVQGRPGSAGQKSPIITAATQGPHSQGTVTWKTVSPSVTTASATQTSRGGKTLLQPQQTAMFGAKQVLRGTNGQPLVIGPLGVLSSAGNGHTFVAQPKSPSVSIAPGGQVINSPTQIRFTTQPTILTSQGQILSGNVSPAMLNQIQVLGPQNTIIGTQPLYLRPAVPVHSQQGIVQAVMPQKGIRQGTDAAGGVLMKSTGTQVKTVAPALVKGVANILPQTARPVGQIPGSPTLAKGVQTGQIKQISRVRAMKPPVKTTSVGQIFTAQPARIAPQGQYGTAQLFTPAMTRPPTVLVPPKPQVVQRPATATTASIATANSSPPQLVTLAVSTLPVTSVSNTQTQTSSLSPEVVEIYAGAAPLPASVPSSPQRSPVPVSTTSTASINPMPVANPIPIAATTPMVSTVKPEPLPTNVVRPKKDDSMDTDSAPVPPVPSVPSGGGVIGAGAGPDRPRIDPDQSRTDSDPPTLGPPMPIRPIDRSDRLIVRSDRIATVIGERQAAIVKPNVLTHVIEGFVIQEASEPFPVQRCSALSDFIQGRTSEQENDSALDNVSDSSSSSIKRRDDGVKLRCEFCGKVDSASRFISSKRFCSRPCAKRYNVGCTRRMGLFKSRARGKIAAAVAVARKHKQHHPMKRIWKRGNGGRVTSGPIKRNPEMAPLTVDNIRTHTSSSEQNLGNDGDNDLGIGMSGLGAPSTMSIETTTTTTSESEGSTTPSGQDESSSPRSPPELEREMDLEACNPGYIPLRHLSQWTVQEVVDFVRNLPGCGMYAEEFNRQEIDGQALMLLKEDHLMTAMNIKLGPALKICNKINSLKDEVP